MGGGVVVRRVPRVDSDTVAGLAQAGVATVHEAGGAALLDPGIRPIQEGRRIAGRAVTVSSAPGDNIMVHAAVEVVEPGDVLLVATTSPSTHGMFGELLATSVMAKGCVGVVIDAGVRDVSDLRRIGLPVWSRAIHAAGTVKATAGSVNVPVVCGGATVGPGDVVVADDDGVAIVERERATEVLEAARLRLQREEEVRARLAAGELGVDLYGLRERLEGMGIRWIDHPEQ
ncbi:MAG TPA: 4-carboxy-4-hydroxy-2-oxoadipate aldolase/oxaloacetate decarboxylase [Acidimicrobiia bacterium]|nr:4-carboxy-4-hydroxy-2-oxoadipate aldolase/oxaloacetate decarboxylase [Acidimicrobiia bacterium]